MVFSIVVFVKWIVFLCQSFFAKLSLFRFFTISRNSGPPHFIEHSHFSTNAEGRGRYVYKMTKCLEMFAFVIPAPSLHLQDFTFAGNSGKMTLVINEYSHACYHVKFSP